MLQFIMDRNVLLYVLAASCAVGVISQLILKQVYERLIRDTQNAGEPAGRLLQQLRQRFQYCTHLNARVGDVQALIRRTLMEYRFWGMHLHQWKRLGMHCLAVSLLCACGGTVLLLRDGGSAISGNAYFWMGILATVLTAAAYGISDIGYREQVLEVGLTDYLENSGAVRPYSAAGNEVGYGMAGRECAAGNEQGCGAAGREYAAESEQGYGAAGRECAAGSEQGYGAAGRECAAGNEQGCGAAGCEYAAGSEQGAASIVSVAAGRKAARRARAETAAAQESRAQREKRELKENLSRVRTGMQETAAAREQKESRAEALRQMDPKEQERILRQILSEYLA